MEPRTTPTLRIRPKLGRRVVDPATRAPLLADGADVPCPLPTYWRRRLGDGDIVLVEDEPPAAAEPDPKSAKQKD